MSLLAIILLIVLALVLLIIELLVVPGGIVGLISVLVMAYGVYETYQVHGNTVGLWILCGTLLLSILLVYYAFSSGAWKLLSHKGSLKGKIDPFGKFTPETGMHGKTLSLLRPMGNALFNDEIIEVSTEGEIIPPQTEIEIVQVRNNKVYVKKKT